MKSARSREGKWWGGPWRPPGAGLSPGASVIWLSHSGEQREGVETRAAALGSPRLYREHLPHLPTLRCTARMLKVSSKDVLVITSIPSCLIDLFVSTDETVGLYTVVLGAMGKLYTCFLVGIRIY